MRNIIGVGASGWSPHDLSEQPFAPDFYTFREDNSKYFMRPLFLTWSSGAHKGEGMSW